MLLEQTRLLQDRRGERKAGLLKLFAHSSFGELAAGGWLDTVFVSRPKHIHPSLCSSGESQGIRASPSDAGTCASSMCRVAVSAPATSLPSPAHIQSEPCLPGTRLAPGLVAGGFFWSQPSVSASQLHAGAFPSASPAAPPAS